jgi:hypothetical protein
MTDVFVSVVVPYARFLEVRARRLAIGTELSPPDGLRTMELATSSAPIAKDEPAHAAARPREEAIAARSELLNRER